MIDGLGDKLKAERVRNGLTQKYIADQLGMDASSISSYETGSATPPAEVLLKISIMLSVTPDYLLGIEKTKSIYVEDLDEGQIAVLQQLVNQFKIANDKAK